MDQLKMAKQMIEFQKATFDNTFNAMVIFQDQAEAMVNSYVEKASILPDDGKKMLREWVQSFRKGSEEYKKAVDESFSRVEAYFAAANKQC